MYLHFKGFALATIIGGLLVDYLGMKRILTGAFLGHLIGISITLIATGFWTLFVGTIFIGIANGFVEAACNSLVATLYPNEKTKMLNRFHVWFLGSIVVGSLLAYLLVDTLQMNWQYSVAILYILLAIYGVLFFRKTLPLTERVAISVSNSDVIKSVFSPLFLLMDFCMLLAAYTELGTKQRIEGLLAETGVSGILILAFINGIMMVVGRGFACVVVHQLSTAGMLLFSAIFSTVGLYWLSMAEGFTTFAAAAIFAVGVCYFWPTMLSFVSEKIPQSGALGLSVMGGLGMFSVSIVLPVMGRFMQDSGSETLRYMTILSTILIIFCWSICCAA